MSARPQRTKNPIKRLNKEQAINTLQVRSRVKKTKTKATPSSQKKKVPKFPPGGKKARVLSILDSLESGKNLKIYNMLYSIYRDASGTLFNRINLNDEQLAKSIEQQYNVMKDNIRQSGGDTNRVNIKLEKDSDKLNFCILMWLDMSHDETVQTNFETFLKSNIVELFLGKSPPYTNDTEMISKMKALKILTDTKTKRGVGKLPGLWPGSAFENKLKVNLSTIFGVGEPQVTLAIGSSLSNAAVNKDKPIYVSIDSESENKSISTLIENSKYTAANRTRRYFLKPIVTLSNRVDPGRLMPTKGIIEEFSKFIQNVNKVKSTQLYNVKDCEFLVGSTRLGLSTLGEGKFNLTLNGTSIPYGITAGEAKKSVNTTEKLSKFLGDFMQILTVLSEPVDRRMVLGTIDGVLCGMYCFLAKHLKKQPRLFIDMSFKQRNQIMMYGVSDLVKTTTAVKQQEESYIGSNLLGNGNLTNTSSSFGSRSPGTANSRLVMRGTPSSSRPAISGASSTGSVVGNSNNNRNNQQSKLRNPRNTNNKARNTNNKAQNANNNANAKLAAMLMKQSTPSKPNNAAKSNKNLAQALANSKRLTNKWQSMKRNAVARRNKIRNNFRAVVNAAVKQNKNRKEVERKARENAENELSRLRAELEEAKKAALSAQKEVENQRRKNIKRKREENRLNINNSRRTRARR
tara:strand:+ start:5033 stop:7093 length:2061 start_codon:yes stop_codon:yes gene_type:complete